MAAVTAAVVGIASAGASTYMSFSNAAKAKREGDAAKTAASKAMADAKKKAETDFYEGLSVPLDAYEAEFENNLAVAQQSTEALQEGDARALAAGVGRVGATQADQAEKTRIAMGEQISDLQATKAQSKDAVNQQLLQMDVANAKEQKQIARESEAARSAAIQQGVKSAGSMVTQIGKAAPLFGKSGAGGGASSGAGGGGGQFARQAAQGQATTGAGGLMGGNQSAFGSGGGPSLNVDNPFEGLSSFTPSALSPNKFF